MLILPRLRKATSSYNAQTFGKTNNSFTSAWCCSGCAARCDLMAHYCRRAACFSSRAAIALMDFLLLINVFFALKIFLEKVDAFWQKGYIYQKLFEYLFENSVHCENNMNNLLLPPLLAKIMLRSHLIKLLRICACTPTTPSRKQRKKGEF